MKIFLSALLAISFSLSAQIGPPPINVPMTAGTFVGTASAQIPPAPDVPATTTIGLPDGNGDGSFRVELDLGDGDDWVCVGTYHYSQVYMRAIAEYKIYRRGYWIGTGSAIIEWLNTDPPTGPDTIVVQMGGPPYDIVTGQIPSDG